MSGVATVTPNPALDLTTLLPVLTPGAVNRVRDAQEDPGGKGINVAGFIASQAPDVAVAATGWLGEANAAPFHAFLAATGITNHFIGVPGSTRINVKIVEDDERVTDLNLPGFAVEAAIEEALLETTGMLARGHAWVALCGSLPRGAAPDLHARLLRRAREAGAKVMLDASGPSLEAALGGRPDCIKPNGEELGELLGERIAGVADAAGAAGRIQARGVGTVIVSLGAEGAVFAEGTLRVHAVGRPSALRSTVGAGDAMVAGWLLGVLRGLSLPDRARLATAFSLGALSTLGPRLPPPAEIEALASAVTVHTLPGAT
ncbi:1-phosphofructokinase family hexose kinase [Roseomonas xinghualingensis]|uniref:1-phosphofructokinase family hexose kinase n=1 Tax=Roseomonas xinghualingensis TaxID=2986475 RepID=UPI0021F1AAD7|nr:1-phosphofructokinase family hexose kinase [Roseomonas sp. SXEYE001]MCV4209943.1 1-phosphofructokinase family hexose kinase [Roseomonas sp. SXEYE001]